MLRFAYRERGEIVRAALRDEECDVLPELLEFWQDVALECIEEQFVNRAVEHEYDDPHGKEPQVSDCARPLRSCLRK